MSLAIVTVLYIAVSVVLSGMVSYTQLKTAPGGKPANLATAFTANGIHWASQDHRHRGAGRADHRGDGADARAVPGAVRDGARRACCRDGWPRPVRAAPRSGSPCWLRRWWRRPAAVFPITKLEEMVNVGTLFAFVLVSAGVIVLRRTRPDLPRGFRAPGVPLLPIASIAACLWLMVNLTALTWVRFGVWLVVGTADLSRLRATGTRCRAVGRRSAEQADSGGLAFWCTKHYRLSRHKTQSSILSNLA